MGVRTDFPRTVRRIDNAWIPLADGTRLAARIWLPDDAETDPVPAILEYLPYRKGDAMARRDARHHPYFAGHGYAAVRVDLRGTGDSDGILLDEYTRQEEDDALEVLAWLAAQPWCTGRVGMFGISWGGFNGLQVAARRPPELQAVITMCASDDRYADDVHYIGGCVLALDMLPWAATMLTLLAQPPDPATVGDGWRDTWFARHGTHAGVRRAVARPPAPRRLLAARLGLRGLRAIEAAVYAIGGWADGYTNAIPRLLAEPARPAQGPDRPVVARVPAGRRARPGDRLPPGVPALVGPLAQGRRHRRHGRADAARVDAGARRARPASTPNAPAAGSPSRRGRRRGSRSPNGRSRASACSRPACPTPTARSRCSHHSPDTTGQDAGAWCADGGAGDWPVDQRAEDGRSLTFTSAPLDERVEVLGFPEVTLDVAADRPRALVAVRLCDVAPDGTSLLVTRGLLNLTHREGHAEPVALEPGRRYTVTVRLDAIAQAIPAGHRLRVAISTSYWPWVWPSPEPVTLTVYAGAGSRLALPVRAPRESDAALPAFGAPEWSAPLEPGGAALRPDEPHPRPRPRGRRPRGPLPVGRRRPPAPRSTAARSSTTRTGRATGSSRATRCRRACGSAASRRSRARTGTPGSRPTAA